MRIFFAIGRSAGGGGEGKPGPAGPAAWALRCNTTPAQNCPASRRGTSVCRRSPRASPTPSRAGPMRCTRCGKMSSRAGPWGSTIPRSGPRAGRCARPEARPLARRRSSTRSPAWSGSCARRPIEAYDMLRWSAKAVLSGGLRRSATIGLFSVDDAEVVASKTATGPPTSRIGRRATTPRRWSARRPRARSSTRGSSRRSMMASPGSTAKATRP